MSILLAFIFSITGYIEEGTQFLENGEYFFFSSPETVTWIITIADRFNIPRAQRDCRGAAPIDPAGLTRGYGVFQGRSPRGNASGAQCHLDTR